MENNCNVSWPGWKTVRLIGRGSFGAVYEIERQVFRLISVVLIVALLSSIVLVVAAESNAIQLTVHCGEEEYRLAVIQENEKWFANIGDLATISGCESSINKDDSTAVLYKKEPFVVLYSIGLDSCVEDGGIYYVPLQDASVAVGIRFYGNEPICAEVYRTPKQMLEDFDDVFFDQRYQITQLLLTDGYWIAESAARVYAIMPFIGSGSLVGAISGEDEAERYRNAFSSILTNNGSTSDFFANMADFNGAVHKNAETLKAVADLTKKDGMLYDLLLKQGVNPDVLDAMAYERDPYDPLDGIFEEWSAVLQAVNFEHFLDLCAFYAVSVDTEESILVAMKRVFENSSNINSRNAVKNLVDARYGDGYIAITDIYDGMIWDISIGYINDKAEELYYGGYAKATQLAARGIDTVFEASDKSEAYIYFPIYASIQQDLYNYYQSHRNDTADNIMYDLRAVAIMYLKAAIAAYEYAAFDESLSGTIDTAIAVLNSELANVLSYTEQEFLPSYTNNELIDWLDSQNDGFNIPSIPSQTESLDFFNETYWHMSFGQSLGYNYVAKFSMDGSFVARSMGSGAYKNGTYSYSDGKLEIIFDIGGFGYPSTIKYSGNKDGFTSLEKYPMQVGEDYYTITPNSDGAEIFEPIETEPMETVSPETESKGRMEDLSYIGTWIFDYLLPLEEGKLVISEDSISVFSPEGDCSGPYAYDIYYDGTYTKLMFVTELGEHGVIVYINPDMIGIYCEEYVENSVIKPSFGATGDGNILYRQGAGTKEFDLPTSYYDWFADDDSYEYLYFPSAKVLYVWNPGMGYFPMYVHDDGSLEYMEAISLRNVSFLPLDASSTSSGFVIIDNK